MALETSHPYIKYQTSMKSLWIKASAKWHNAYIYESCLKDVVNGQVLLLYIWDIVHINFTLKMERHLDLKNLQNQVLLLG
jgi:hypothetical protein